MKKPPSAIRHHYVLVGYVILLCAWLSCVARCDTWGRPQPFEVGSENGDFFVRVIPGIDEVKPRLVVFSRSGGETNLLWTRMTSHHVAPVAVVISDDGTAVVTFDEWGSAGYGESVVAVYSERGLLASYSLETFAPPRGGRGFDGYLNYRGEFPHSTSSRHWRESSVGFFFDGFDYLGYYLWLDWRESWIGWRMSNGWLVTLSDEERQRLNAEGRALARKQLESEVFDPGAAKFLATLRVPEDRALIEKGLMDRDFGFGAGSVRNGDFFAFTSRSWNRDNASEALALWDGKDFRWDENPYLGTVRCEVRLPLASTRDYGFFRLYLIPKSTDLSIWDFKAPEHYLVAELSGMDRMILAPKRICHSPTTFSSSSTASPLGNIV